MTAIYLESKALEYIMANNNICWHQSCFVGEYFPRPKMQIIFHPTFNAIIACKCGKRYTDAENYIADIFKNNVNPNNENSIPRIS